MRPMTATQPGVDRLHFTGDDEADRLLASDPLALLIGFALDQQVTVQKAFSGPAELRRRIGHLDATLIAAMDPMPWTPSSGKDRRCTVFPRRHGRGHPPASHAPLQRFSRGRGRPPSRVTRRMIRSNVGWPSFGCWGRDGPKRTNSHQAFADQRVRWSADGPQATCGHRTNGSPGVNLGRFASAGPLMATSQASGMLSVRRVWPMPTAISASAGPVTRCSSARLDASATLT